LSARQNVEELLGPRDLPALRCAGRAAAETLALAGSRIALGVRTADIDRWVRAETERRGGRPSQLGYHGFPAAVCVSPNHVVCHGIPGDERLSEGDIVNVDVTTELDRFHGDTSATFFVGEPDERSRRLVETARRCRDAGISVVRAGARRRIRFVRRRISGPLRNGAQLAQNAQAACATSDHPTDSLEPPVRSAAVPGAP
jgi:methionyl aminopeptidase